MNELAGFSLDRTSKSNKKTKAAAKTTTTKTTAAEENDQQQQKSWLRRKTNALKTKTTEKLKRHNKLGADESESVSVFSVSTRGSRSINGSLSSGKVKHKTENSKDKSNTNHFVNNNPVSILRKISYNNYITTLLIAEGAAGATAVTTHNADVASDRYPSESGASVVRFAQGTVFQDPNLLRRKKVPRIYNGKWMMRKNKNTNNNNNTNKKVLAVAAQQPSSDPSSLEATTMTTLVISGGDNNDSSCIPIEQMAPLVNEWVAATTSGMNCYVFR